eukprot:m.168619 g.168619  ORF g.168619 m.168619 type:complete len:364 (-) comp12981_c0_seq1:2063-3154(-)
MAACVVGQRLNLVEQHVAQLIEPSNNGPEVLPNEDPNEKDQDDVKVRPLVARHDNDGCVRVLQCLCTLAHGTTLVRRGTTALTQRWGAVTAARWGWAALHPLPWRAATRPRRHSVPDVRAGKHHRECRSVGNRHLGAKREGPSLRQGAWNRAAAHCHRGLGCLVREVENVELNAAVECRQRRRARCHAGVTRLRVLAPSRVDRHKTLKPLRIPLGVKGKVPEGRIIVLSAGLVKQIPVRHGARVQDVAFRLIPWRCRAAILAVANVPDNIECRAEARRGPVVDQARNDRRCKPCRHERIVLHAIAELAVGVCAHGDARVARVEMLLHVVKRRHGHFVVLGDGETCPLLVVRVEVENVPKTRGE